MNLRGTRTSNVASGFSEPRTELAPGYAADFPGHVRKSFKPRSRTAEFGVLRHYRDPGFPYDTQLSTV